MESKSQRIGGVVSAVEQVKRHRDRVAVFVDGLFSFELGHELALERGVRRGETITGERIDELLNEDQRRTAKSRAFHFLSYRSRTENEVRKKLSGLHYEKHIVDEVVETLHRLGYLDDEAFSEQFVRSRIRSKAHGPRRVRIDLLKLGVDAEVVDATVASACEADEIRLAAGKAGRKYWRRAMREPDDRKRRWKFVQYLMRRGFDGSLAGDIYAELLAEEAE